MLLDNNKNIFHNSNMTLIPPTKLKTSPARLKANRKYAETTKGKKTLAKYAKKYNQDPEVKTKKLLLDKEYSRIAIPRVLKDSFDEVYEKTMKRSKMSYGEFLEICIAQSEILLPLIPKYKPIKKYNYN